MATGMQVFKDDIRSYLDGRAAQDALFAQSYAKEGKSVDGCVDYIISEVKKMASANSRGIGLTDEQVYSLAVHYYDEDDAKADGEAVNCTVVVNHEVKLTEQEKEQARKEAQERLIQEEMRRLQSRGKTAKEQAKKKTEEQKASAEEPAEMCLFDL